MRAETEQDTTKNEGRNAPVKNSRKILLKSEFLQYVREIKDLKFEKAVIFDKEGNFLFRMNGKRNNIDFRYCDMFLLQENIFMHNHPRGGGFSLPDIRSACALNMAGMIVATHRFIFMFFPPEKQEHFAVSDYYKILKCYRIRLKSVPLSKRFRPYDEIWRDIAGDLGYRYLKIRI
ncbi:hypothetical protein J2128_001722 [Methanomicrobium sp. W14]|uniref:hypothetical protein n=1 Tax=Methanomicrobium sp. W14 TaxID=2817839 RepID=UPI001AEA4627|nr:hypothetical protein [Methanomicrobium sp. W14]MBP2133768.1 hypothetical protein [Methanomicrobium sp. W14]